jgi:hypothetical protein
VVCGQLWKNLKVTKKIAGKNIFESASTIGIQYDSKKIGKPINNYL